MVQKAHTNNHYITVVFMKNWNTKPKIARYKLGLKKTRREEGRLYRLIHPLLWVWKPTLEKMFFKTLKKNLPQSNPFSKILHKNTIKISVNCTRNMKSISTHNKKILTPKNKQVRYNCRVKNSCPLDNKCLISQLIYQVNVTNTLDEGYKYYLGLAGTTFKERYSNHKSLIKNKNSKNSTELLKYVWPLRENNKMPSIKWKILKILYSKAKSSYCKLRLTEKMFILNILMDGKCLNKKTEFINKYCHQNKLLLKNIKDSMDWNLVWIFVFKNVVRIVFSFYYLLL